jgi:hypothetical protein
MGPFGGNLQYEASCEAIVFSPLELIRALSHTSSNLLQYQFSTVMHSGALESVFFWVADASSVSQRTESAWTSH